MLLTEYDEQAHIESERKIAAEEAYAQGVETGLEQGIETGFTQGMEAGEELLGILGEILLKESRMEDLKRIMKDKSYRDKLYEEYGIKSLD